MNTNPQKMSGDDKLRHLQSWMQQALMSPSQVDQSQTLTTLLPSPNLSPQACLGIYQRSYYSRLLACLREQFPALCYCLGENVFNAFSEQYLSQYPPNSYTLHMLGHRFPAFLKATRPDKEQPECWVEFMLELADFEYIAFSMFDAQGDEGRILNPDTDYLSDDKLQLQRCIDLHQSAFPVAQYYCLVRDGKSPVLPEQIPTFTALVRKNYLTKLVTMDWLQFTLLDKLKCSNSLEEAIEKTALVSSKLANKDIYAQWSRFGGIRHQWMKLGFFVQK